jgi:hypothetical protein
VWIGTDGRAAPTAPPDADLHHALAVSSLERFHDGVTEHADNNAEEDNACAE